MALSNTPPSDSSRLPTYRSTHLGRFHPYPRSAARVEDALMQTVDYRSVEHRTGLEPILEEPELVRLRPIVVRQEVPDGDVSSLELDYPVVGDAHFLEQAVRVDEANDHVKTGIFRLLVAFRRRSLALLAVGNFLKGGRGLK